MPITRTHAALFPFLHPIPIHYRFIPFVLIHFHHPASPIFDAASDSTVTDPVSEIKYENENGRGVIPTDPGCFHPYPHPHATPHACTHIYHPKLHILLSKTCTPLTTLHVFLMSIIICHCNAGENFVRVG